jgi:hypothetical protein
MFNKGLTAVTCQNGAGEHKHLPVAERQLLWTWNLLSLSLSYEMDHFRSTHLYIEIRTERKEEQSK